MMCAGGEMGRHRGVHSEERGGDHRATVAVPVHVLEPATDSKMDRETLKGFSNKLLYLFGLNESSIFSSRCVLKIVNYSAAFCQFAGTAASARVQTVDTTA